MRYLLPFLFLLSACGPIPVQMSSQSSSQRQMQKQSQESAQTASQEAEQQSSHASESKQGTNSMPVIVVCIQNNSASSSCATPQKDGPIGEAILKRIK